MGLFGGYSLPPPDGAITAPDRAACGWCYSGLTYSAVVASVFINIAQAGGRAIARMIAFSPVSTRKDKQ